MSTSIVDSAYATQKPSGTVAAAFESDTKAFTYYIYAVRAATTVLMVSTDSEPNLD